MVIYTGRMVIDISRNENSLNFDFDLLLDVFYPPVWNFMVKKMVEVRFIPRPCHISCC
jgi:hypothetical protein